MRIQHVSVMFVIIFIPIILVTSYFISLQVNTIKLESDYSDKLLKATYDAMTAFELNTANEDLSTVSDSLRSILDASTNIFFNTLCTNLGVSNASKSFVQPFIPAILYTMYDGYYIYSPTNLPEICTDDFGRTIRTSDYGVSYEKTMVVNGRTIGFYKFDKSQIVYDVNTPTEPVGGSSINYNSLPNEIKQEYGQILYKNNVNKVTGEVTYSTEIHTISGDSYNSTYYKRSYILKSYIPYSARYEGSTSGISYNVTINYTLDNFITVEGMIGNVYYTKSGYLIESDLVKEIEADGTKMDPDSWTLISEETLLEMVNDPANHEVIITLSDGTVFSNKTGAASVTLPTGGSETQYWEDASKAVEYYVKSFIFSNWFYENLSEIKESDLKNSQYSVIDVQAALNSAIEVNNDDIKTELQKDMVYSFGKDDTQPFKPSNKPAGFKNDPESEESDFYEHKRKVIKNSITYNMILSMLVYSEESGTTEYNMPVLSEPEWDTILNNISITAFMQGMGCGLKYYNNYAIVTSTNNEISVTDNEIYYVPREIEEIDLDGNGSIDKRILANLDDHDLDLVIETAHRIDCEKLQIGKDVNFQGGNWLGCISFKSKEIKYDKILNKDGSYSYDHKAYTDYDCIVDSNYTVKNVDNSYKDGNTDVKEYLVENVAKYKSGALAPGNTEFGRQLEYKLLAYRIAIAKERNNLYKTTSFTENYGWQVINPAPGTSSGSEIHLNELSNKNINQISKIEIVIEGANNSSPGVYTDEITASYDTGDNYNDVSQTISTTSTSRRTVELKKDFNTYPPASVLKIKISSLHSTQFTVDSIKFYFK